MRCFCIADQLVVVGRLQILRWRGASCRQDFHVIPKSFLHSRIAALQVECRRVNEKLPKRTTTDARYGNLRASLDAAGQRCNVGRRGVYDFANALIIH